MFVCGFETYNDHDFAGAYAAFFYDANRLRDRWDKGLSHEETDVKTKTVIIFKKTNGNAIINLIKFFSENYEGDERFYVDKEGDEVLSSYRKILLAQNKSWFQSLVELNSSNRQIEDIKILKTAWVLLSLSFRCGVKIVITVEVPLYGKFTCTKTHISGSSVKDWTGIWLATGVFWWGKDSIRNHKAVLQLVETYLGIIS